MKKIAPRIALTALILFIAYEGYQISAWKEYYSDWKVLKSNKEETLEEKVKHEKLGRIPNYLARQDVDWDNIHLLETDRKMIEAESGMITAERKSMFLSMFCPPVRKVSKG